MYGRVAPPLVVETARGVQRFKVRAVGVGAEEGEGGDFEITPEVTEVPGVALAVARVQEVRHQQATEGKWGPGGIEHAGPEGGG